MSDALLLDAQGPIRTITINRPAQRNALPPAEWLHLRDLLTEIAGDRSARVIVVRGAGGRAFSSGYDVGALHELRAQGIVLSTPDDPFEIALATVVEHPLPIIAMVAGYAVGGGCTLAAGCDLRIVGASSRFGMPPAKLGLVYSATELRPFVDLIGPARTKWMFFSGRLIDAERALQIGLVDEVRDDGELEANRARDAWRGRPGRRRRADRRRDPACQSQRRPRRGDAGVPGETSARVSRRVAPDGRPRTAEQLGQLAKKERR
jgi:enoyl-CoA hydratase/carnithine racemase